MPYVEREKGVRIHYNHIWQGISPGLSARLLGQRLAVGLPGPGSGLSLPHCIVIEARGHGLSSKPLSGYSIQDMAADDAPRPWPPSALTGRFWSAIRWAGYGPCR